MSSTFVVGLSGSDYVRPAALFLKASKPDMPYLVLIHIHIRAVNKIVVGHISIRLGRKIKTVYKLKQRFYVLF